MFEGVCHLDRGEHNCSFKTLWLLRCLISSSASVARYHAGLLDAMLNSVIAKAVADAKTGPEHIWALNDVGSIADVGGCQNRCWRAKEENKGEERARGRRGLGPGKSRRVKSGKRASPLDLPWVLVKVSRSWGTQVNGISRRCHPVDVWL